MLCMPTTAKDLLRQTASVTGLFLFPSSCLMNCTSSRGVLGGNLHSAHDTVGVSLLEQKSNLFSRKGTIPHVLGGKI